jgi:segregation and condensation protein B
MNDQELKFAIEALLFASEKPLRADEIRQAFEENAGEAEVRAALEALKADYETQGRGFRLVEIAGGWQLASDSRFEAHLKRFYQARLKKRLSQATLETLAIIAYRQPVTRADIEFVRGVNVDAAMKTLLEKGLVKIVGKKEVPGRPLLYGTTQEFLDHFGLASLKDLPPLTEFTEKDIEPHLLPPEMKAADADAEGGEQKPIGCANEPEEPKTPEGGERP